MARRSLGDTWEALSTFSEKTGSTWVENRQPPSAGCGAHSWQNGSRQAPAWRGQGQAGRGGLEGSEGERVAQAGRVGAVRGAADTAPLPDHEGPREPAV